MLIEAWESLECMTPEETIVTYNGLTSVLTAYYKGEAVASLIADDFSCAPKSRMLAVADHDQIEFLRLHEDIVSLDDKTRAPGRYVSITSDTVAGFFFYSKNGGKVIGMTDDMLILDDIKLDFSKCDIDSVAMSGSNLFLFCGDEVRIVNTLTYEKGAVKLGGLIGEVAVSSDTVYARVANKVYKIVHEEGEWKLVHALTIPKLLDGEVDYALLDAWGNRLLVYASGYARAIAIGNADTKEIEYIFLPRGNVEPRDGVISHNRVAITWGRPLSHYKIVKLVYLPNAEAGRG